MRISSRSLVTNRNDFRVFLGCEHEHFLDLTWWKSTPSTTRYLACMVKGPELICHVLLAGCLPLTV